MADNSIINKPIRRPDPEERAVYIYKEIQKLNPKPTTWDLICFCTETLAMLSTEFEILKPIAFRLISQIYTIHNNTPEPLPSCLSPRLTGQNEVKDLQK